MDLISPTFYTELQHASIMTFYFSFGLY